MSDSDPWTIKRLLDWTSDFFGQKEFESPRLDAEVLLANSLDCQRIDLYARFDEEPSTDRLTQYRGWVKRRAEGEPVAYLVGKREFYSLNFEVDARVLIPRPETEHLITETLDRFQEAQQRELPLTIADVGTGSGIIAITLAKYLPGAKITAIDISQDAIAIAQKNAAAHQVESQIEFLTGNLLTDLNPEIQFDAIVSNPPYVGLNERESLSSEVVDFEPELALFSTDSEGIAITQQLIQQSVERLTSGGWLIFETSPMLAGQLKHVVENSRAFDQIKVVKDLARRDRIVVARRIPS